MTQTPGSPEPIDIPVTTEQFMRDANAAQRDYNERIAPLLGLQVRPLPYPEVEKADAR